MGTTIKDFLSTLFSRTLLFALWFASVALSYFALFWVIKINKNLHGGTWPDGAFLATAVGGLPYLLAYWVSTRLQLGSDRTSFVLFTSGDDLESVAKTQATVLWNFEARRFRGTLERAYDYLYLFGALTSVIVELCIAAYIIARGELGGREQVALPVAIGTATIVYFALSFGSCLRRAANADASARLFAGASRNQLLILASSFFWWVPC